MQKKKNQHLLGKICVTAAAITASIHAVNCFVFYLAQRGTKKEEGNRVFPWKYGNVHYKVNGSGRPLLLVHDLRIGNSRREWHRIRDYYSGSRKVYSIDLLGCGFSDRPAMTYSNYMYVQLLTDFVNMVIGEPCDVAASGLSCSFVAMANKMDPSLFNRMVFVHPTPLAQTRKTADKNKLFIKKVLELPFIGTFLYNLVFTREHFRKETLDEFVNRSLSESYADGMFEASHKQDGRNRYLYASLTSGFLTTPIGHAVQVLDKPLLLICGSKQPGGAETLEEYQKFNPAIQAVTISGARLYPHIERFPRVGKAMDRFLA